MSMSVGASSSSALSYLQSLMQQGSAKEAKKSAAADPLSMLMQAIAGDAGPSAQADATAAPAKPSGGGTCQPFSSGTMSALLSAQGQQSADRPSAKLFAKLDADGNGTISKSEFAGAASKAGADSAVADAVFAKIDGDGDGAISQSELTKADQSGHHRHIGGGPPPPDGAGADAAASGATTSSTTNADGSTTTTISYADGSKITMTTAATAQGSDATSGDTAGTSAGSASHKSAFNLLEQLIKLQSQMLTTAASTLSAVA